MRDLTSGVDAFRDKLAKDGRDRAAEIRNNLSAYAQDRAEGTAIWTGTAQKSRSVKERPTPAATAMAQRSESHAAPPEEASPAAAPTHSANVAKSGRHANRSSGQGRRGGQSE